jgi:hypothetical protein
MGTFGSPEEGGSPHRSKSSPAMTASNWTALGKELEEILRLRTPPVAITFSEQRPDGVTEAQAGGNNRRRRRQVRGRGRPPVRLKGTPHTPISLREE